MSPHVRSGLLACLAVVLAAMTAGCKLESCSIESSLFDGTFFNGWFDYAHSASYWDRGVITDPSAMTGGLHSH